MGQFVSSRTSQNLAQETYFKRTKVCIVNYFFIAEQYSDLRRNPILRESNSENGNHFYLNRQTRQLLCNHQSIKSISKESKSENVKLLKLDIAIAN